MRKTGSLCPLWAAGVLAMCAGTAMAQPANDLCTAAIDLNAQTLPYSSGAINVLTGTTDSNASPSCDSSTTAGGNRGIWWRYTTGATAERVNFQLPSGVTTDHAFTLWTGPDCNTLTQWLCTDGDATQQGLTIVLPADTTFYIMSSLWTATIPTAAVNLGLAMTPPATVAALTSNGQCASAQVISTFPYTAPAADYSRTLGSLALPTCGTPSFFSARTAGSVWYTFTPSTLSTLTLGETSAENVTFSVWTGTDCGSLAQIACGDGGTGTTESFSTPALVAGTTYYIQVSRGGTAAASRSWPADGTELTVTATVSTPPAPPANATCGTATTIGALPYVSGPVEIGGSPVDTSINPSCDSASANPTGAASPTWWSFTPVASGVFQLQETTAVDTVGTVWTGACGALTQVACDDANFDGAAGLVLALEGGTTYSIAVSRFSSSVGGFGDTVNLSVNQLAGPANDDCASAVVVTAPTSLTATSVDARAALSDVGLACNTTGFTASTTAGVWYQVSNPTADWQNVTYTETSTNTDSIWGVFTGSCGSLTNVFCQVSDTANSYAIAPGQTLYFLVGRQGSSAQPTSATSYTVAFTFANLTSACCNTAANTCTVVSASACATAGGVWSGPRNVTCSAPTSAATACAGAPGNDLCPNAVVIAGSIPQLLLTANAASATDDLDVSCNSVTAGGGSPPFFTRFGVWYSYTTGADPGTLSLSELNASNDVIIQTFTGPCNALVPVTCLDAVETTTGGNFPLNANTTYSILVGMFGNSTQPSTAAASYQLSVNSFTPVTGGCCNVTTCSITTASACAGVWLGAGSTCASIPPTFEVANAVIPDAIESPSFVPGVLTRTLTATQAGTVSTVSLRLNMTSTFIGDYRVRLTAPNGATATILNRPSGSTATPVCPADGAIGDGSGWTGLFIFEDVATTGINSAALAATGVIAPGSYRAQDCDGTLVSLDTVFAGSPASGDWTLEISDRDSVLTATLVDWGLVINGVAPTPCDNAGSCCVGTTCSITVNAAACTGTFTAGGSCSPDPCSAPATVVCCRGVTCAVIAAVDCTAPAGVGIRTVTGTTCAGQSAINAGCCYADFNKSNVKDVADIFAYLSAWFANSPFADVGGDGTGTRDVADIFAFLSAWFAGCT